MFDQRLTITSLLARQCFKSFSFLFLAHRVFLSSKTFNLYNPLQGKKLGPIPKNLKPGAPLKCFIKIIFLFEKLFLFNIYYLKNPLINLSYFGLFVEKLYR